jgi:hypothetical protein
MLVQFPIRIFADVASIGYDVRVHCPICRRESRIDPSSPDLRERPFFTVRFRCKAVRHMGRPCPRSPASHWATSISCRPRLTC